MRCTERLSTKGHYARHEQNVRTRCLICKNARGDVGNWQLQVHHVCHDECIHDMFHRRGGGDGMARLAPLAICWAVAKRVATHHQEAAHRRKIWTETPIQQQHSFPPSAAEPRRRRRRLNRHRPGRKQEQRVHRVMRCAVGFVLSSLGKPGKLRATGSGPIDHLNGWVSKPFINWPVRPWKRMGRGCACVEHCDGGLLPYGGSAHHCARTSSLRRRAHIAHSAFARCGSYPRVAGLACGAALPDLP